MSVVRELLVDAIDYAGLFPPAGLGMEETVRNYAAYRKSPDRWALGKLVVPVARLAEFESKLRQGPAFASVQSVERSPIDRRGDRGFQVR